MRQIAFVEDHPEMRLCLRLLIRLLEDVDLIWEASNVPEMLDCLQRRPPDVLVMDIYMPGTNGLTATKQVVKLASQTRIILISFERSRFIARQAADSGAHGFLPKEDLVTLLKPAIEGVLRGETIFVE